MFDISIITPAIYVARQGKSPDKKARTREKPRTPIRGSEASSLSFLSESN